MFLMFTFKHFSAHSCIHEQNSHALPFLNRTILAGTELPHWHFVCKRKLALMKKHELKELCQESCLSVSGNKAQLITHVRI